MTASAGRARCALMKRGVIYATAAIVVAAAVIIGGRYVIANRPLTVSVAAVEENVAIEVFGLGTVEARIMSKVSFEVGSTLAQVNVDHGDRVKRGEVIALLNADEQRARTERARAAVQASEASLARSEAVVLRQAAVLAQKQENHRRQQELLAKGVATIEKAEEAERDLKVAEADHAVAASDVAVARAATATARADLLREEVLLQKHELRAPFDAIVVERHLEAGTAVKAGEPVYTLADPASIWGLAYVEEARAGAIAEGQPARVRLRSVPGLEIAARVVRIGIESDRVSEERRVWVKCEVCPPSFHLGEQAEVIITTGILPEALLVPESSVSGFDGHGGKVWVDDKGFARQIAVNFGARTLDGRVAVSSGVPEGGAVIIAPTGSLSEGRAVRRAAEAPP